MNLQLKNLQYLTHNGNYSCKIILKNRQHIHSDQIEFKVKFDPIFNQTDSVVLVTERRLINLTCSVEAYPLPGEIKWLLKSIPSNEYKISTSETGTSRTSCLEIPNAKIYHSGLYTCSVESGVTLLKRQFNVTVDHEPLFLTKSKNITVDENQSVEFVCSVVQRQLNKSRLIWKSLTTNEHVLADEEYQIYDRYSSVIKITHVNRSHTGMFACVLENSPEYSITFGLFVKCKRTF